MDGRRSAFVFVVVFLLLQDAIGNDNEGTGTLNCLLLATGGGDYNNARLVSFSHIFIKFDGDRFFFPFLSSSSSFPYT